MHVATETQATAAVAPTEPAVARYAQQEKLQMIGR